MKTPLISKEVFMVTANGPTPTFAQRPMRSMRHCFVLMGVLIMQAGVLHAGSARAQNSYLRLSIEGKVMAVQQGRAVFVERDDSRFDRQWQAIDLREDGTFLLRNRGTADACLARPSGPVVETSGVRIVGCSGTNDRDKRWYTGLSSSGDVEGQFENLRNLASTQLLVRFYFCFTGPCGPDTPGLMSNDLAQAIAGGSNTSFMTWQIQRL